MELFIDIKLFLWHKIRVRYGPFDPVGGAVGSFIDHEVIFVVQDQS